jgi:hypothetical protein
MTDELHYTVNLTVIGGADGLTRFLAALSSATGATQNEVAETPHSAPRASFSVSSPRKAPPAEAAEAAEPGEPGEPAVESKPKSRRGPGRPKGAKNKPKPKPATLPESDEDPRFDLRDGATECSLNDVRVALRDCIEATDTPTARAVFAKFGAAKIGDLKPQDYTAVVATLGEATLGD